MCKQLLSYHRESPFKNHRENDLGRSVFLNRATLKNHSEKHFCFLIAMCKQLLRESPFKNHVTARMTWEDQYFSIEPF